MQEAGADAVQIAMLQMRISDVMVQLQQDSRSALESEIGLGVGIFVTVASVAFAVASGGATAPRVGVLGVGGAITGTTIFNAKVTADLTPLYSLQAQLGAEVAQVAALAAITESLDGLVARSEAAQHALSEVLEHWETLEEKLAAVIDEVTKAKTEMAPILAKLDIEVAQTQWGQLVEFATRVQETASSVTVGATVSYPPASQAA